MNLKPEAYLLCLLVQCGALLPAKTSTMLHEPTNYRVKPNLYGAVVSESGQKKTPITNAISVYPMEELEDKARKDFEDAMTTYEVELANWEAKKKKRDNRDGDENPKPALPARKVYTFNAATGESIPAQADRCPEQSLLFLCDELAGMFKAANEYRGGKGSDEEDLLEYWSGGGKKVLRVAGVKVDVKNVSLSIFGNIQPDVLAGFIGDGSDSNGKFARFDFVQQPVAPTHLSMKDSPCTLTPTLSKLYAYLDSIKDARFELSTQAHDHFIKFYNWCDDKRVIEPQQGVRAMFGKMPEKVGKLATILHCIRAFESGKPPGREISFDAVKAAAKFAGYCRRQVETMNSQIVTPSALAPRLIKILDLAKRKGGTVTGRDVSLSFNKDYRPTSSQIKQYLEELVALNYGSTTYKGASISFTLGKTSTPSTLACNVDTVTVPGVDVAVHGASTASTLLSKLEDEPVESVDERGRTVDANVHTLKPLSGMALSSSVDGVDVISPLSEKPETLMQSCVTPKPQKLQPVKKPIGIGDDVTVARSDKPVYRGVKGKIIAVERMADGSKGFKVEFVKAVRGMLNGLFAPTDLLRTLNC